MRSLAARPSVCLMTETFFPVTGGGETASKVVVEGLCKAGFQTMVITRRSDVSFPSRESLGDATILRLPPSGPGHLKKWGLCLTALIRLLLSRSKYDVILVNGYRVLGIPAILASWLLKKPCIFKADNLGEWSGRFHDPGLARFGMRHDRMPFRLFIGLRNKFFKTARKFVSISSAVADELMQGGIPASQIENIPNSVNVDQFRPVDREQKRRLRDSLGLPDVWPVAVYTGRIETSKGIPLLVESWNLILQEYPSATLLLVGGGGPHLHNCEPEMKDFVRDHQLEERIRFTGSVSNVWEYLQASDIFVFPSEREAFGISVAEAMACALPVVSTDIPGLSDVVVPGKSAEVFPNGSQQGFVDALRRILVDPKYAEALGQYGRKRATALFSEESVVERYVGLIEQATDAKPPSPDIASG